MVCVCAGLTLPEAGFATIAGLRGALTLILISDFIIHSNFYTGQPTGTHQCVVAGWAL
jgi:hypothetical protein